MKASARSVQRRRQGGRGVRYTPQARSLPVSTRSRQQTLKARWLFAGAVLAVALVAVIWDALYLQGVDSLDVFIYRCYAQGFWQGAHAAHDPALRACTTVWNGTPRQFHTFPREYPAPALALFSLPLLLPWLSFGTAYVLWMALFLLAATALLAWRGPPEAAVALPLYALLAGWSFTLQRYDLLPGLCILLALILAQTGRPRGAAAALAVAAALKLFPVVLFPALLIAARRAEHGRWRLDLVGIFVGVCLLGMLPALALDPSSILAPLHFELARPLHIESLAGSLLWAPVSAILGPGAGPSGGISVVFSYNSLNVAGGPQALLEALATLLGLVAIVVACARAWRGVDSLSRTAIVILVALIAAGKVFSPQYLLWVLPAVALTEGIRLRWLLIAALTCFIMQSYYTIPLSNLPWTTQFMGAIVVRDLLLCGLVALYLLMPGDLTSDRWPNAPAWRWMRP